MYKSEIENPVITLRVPLWMTSALKIQARREGTTVSEMLRGLAEGHLRQNGISGPGDHRIKGKTTREDV